MDRRHFFTATALTVAGLSLPSRLAASSSLLKPPALQTGMGVGLISPASATFRQEQLEIVIDAVKALGLIPYPAPHLLDRYGYLAGKDRDRADDVNQFFTNPQINLLLPLQGGWGCSRILPYLDYSTIKKNPKVIVGFSDITALILGIYAQTGLITFHGPHGLTGWRSPQTDYFRRVLFQGEAIKYQNEPDPADSDRLMQVNNRIQTITAGKAQGKLIGGNLTILSTLVGTPYFPDVRGAILFVEEVGESIYRVDRFLTHLKLAGILDQLGGFIFGQCTNCPPDWDYGSLTLEEVIRDHIEPLSIPAWSGANIGHLETIITLPIGLPVEIDAVAGTIQLLVSGVER